MGVLLPIWNEKHQTARRLRDGDEVDDCARPGTPSGSETRARASRERTPRIAAVHPLCPIFGYACVHRPLPSPDWGLSRQEEENRHATT